MICRLYSNGSAVLGDHPSLFSFLGFEFIDATNLSSGTCLLQICMISFR